MPRIPIAKLQDGTVLSRPVMSPSNALLVEAGTMVTAEIRAKLANGGVRHVFIVNKPDDGRLREELSALEARFRSSEDVELMRMLQGLVREHLEEIYR